MTKQEVSIMARKEAPIGAVTEALSRGNRYFSKETVDDPHPAKVVTMADIEKKWAEEKMKKKSASKGAKKSGPSKKCK